MINIIHVIQHVKIVQNKEIQMIINVLNVKKDINLDMILKMIQIATIFVNTIIILMKIKSTIALIPQIVLLDITN